MLRTEVLEAKSLIEQKFVVRDRKCAPIFSDKKVDLYGKDIGMMVGKLYTYRDISVRDHEDYCEMTTDGEFVYFGVHKMWTPFIMTFVVHSDYFKVFLISLRSGKLRAAKKGYTDRYCQYLNCLLR